MNPNIKKHPYYVVDAIDALADATPEERQELVRRIALQIGDPIALRTLLGIDPAEFASFYPDMQLPELSTADTIDSFIDRFGDASHHEPDSLEELLPPPGAVFSLSDLEDLPEIDGVTADSIPTLDIPSRTSPAKPENKPKAKPEVEPEAKPEPKPVPQAALSESLAKVFIKNGNYQKALEIITEISLNNPKKSVYFAHQIRFLKKLIAISNGSETISNI